jgi:Bacterial Ig domain
VKLRRRLSAAIVVAPLLLWAVAAPAQAGLLGIAKNDKYAVEFETTLHIAAPGVLANDSDLGTAKAELEEPVRDGTLVLKPDGSFTYTPDDGFDGSDQFKYSVRSSISGLLLKANVTILVAREVASPTPKPEPPAPSPKPPPTPTPTPTPRPAATFTPRPSSVVPLPSGSTPRPSAPSPTAAASRSVTGSAVPSPSPTMVAVAGPITNDPGDGGDGHTGSIVVPPDPGTVADLDIGVASSGPAADLSVGIDTGGIGVEWLVPTVAVTVPGLLLMLAVLAQSLGALAWIPVVRRWLGDRGRRRREPLASG